MKTQNEIINILKTIKPELYKKYGIQKLALFGSYAKGKANQNSDIDILFDRDLNHSFSLFDLIDIKEQLENLLQTKIDLIPEEGLNKKLKKYIYKDIKYV